MITSWSPSRWEKYKECPRRAKFDLLDKLCPVCFRGSLSGGFGTPVVCSSGAGCHIPTPAAIERGTEMHDSLEKYVKGDTAKLHTEIKNKAVKKLAGDLRKEFKRARVKAELDIVLDSMWRPVSKFTKGAWFRSKLDIFWQKDAKTGIVIDWKSGGVDKKTGKIRAAEKYDDPLAIYSLVGLVVFPTVERIESNLVFLDAGDAQEPVVARDDCNLTRGGIESAKKYWVMKTKPMFSDKIFAPRPSDGACRFCPFRKGHGGPCPY